MIKKLMCIGCCICVLTLTSCYDNREIDSSAIVMAVGIENDPGNRNLNKYTFAIADSGGFSSGSEGDAVLLITHSERGINIRDAVNNANRKLSKKLSFSHLSLILFSVSNAQNGMYDDICYFENSNLTRPQTFVGITKISPETYLSNLRPELEANPEKYFRNIMQNPHEYVSTMRLCDFTNAYHCKTQVLAPVISGNLRGKNFEENDVYVEGSALISNGKMVAHYKENWLMGLILSNKAVDYGNIRLKSVRRPRIFLKTNSITPAARLTLYVVSDGNPDTVKIAEDAEKILLKCAASTHDVIGIKGYGRKSFLLRKDYDKTDWNHIIKNTKFEVIIKTQEGEV